MITNKKLFNKKPGIYRILNLKNGKFYIGSAKNLGNRLATHIKDLKYKKHHNPHLQAAWNKYGSNAFAFEAIFLVESPEFCIPVEQLFLDTLQPYYKEIGYNKCKFATSSLGVKASDATRKKQSQAAKIKYLRHPCKRGNASPSAKLGLTWEMVGDIRNLYKAGNYTQQQIAIKYNLPRRHVGSILEGRIWNNNEGHIKRLRPAWISNSEIKEVLDLHKSGMSWRQIGLRLKKDPCYLLKFLRKKGLIDGL